MILLLLFRAVRAQPGPGRRGAVRGKSWAEEADGSTTDGSVHGRQGSRQGQIFPACGQALKHLKRGRHGRRLGECRNNDDAFVLLLRESVLACCCGVDVSRTCTMVGWSEELRLEGGCFRGSSCSLSRFRAHGHCCSARRRFLVVFSHGPRREV